MFKSLSNKIARLFLAFVCALAIWYLMPEYKKKAYFHFSYVINSLHGGYNVDFKLVILFYFVKISKKEGAKPSFLYKIKEFRT